MKRAPETRAKRSDAGKPRVRTPVEVVVSTRLTADEAERLKAWAEAKGISNSTAVAYCVRRVTGRK